MRLKYIVTFEYEVEKEIYDAIEPEDIETAMKNGTLNMVSGGAEIFIDGELDETIDLNKEIREYLDSKKEAK